MTLSDEQAAFEKQFPIPPSCIRCGDGYAVTEYNAWAAHTYCEVWKGWKARALLAAQPAVQQPAEDAPSDRELLDHLIEGVREFRKEPMLGKLLRLRSTPGYVAMTTAWEDAVDTLADRAIKAQGGKQ
ncbi:MAG: hypothetical protein LCH79_15495 [Proteobacteria bacterium]|nr:hypothetical protein [Pseudomonadota bacterium]